MKINSKQKASSREQACSKKRIKIGIKTEFAQVKLKINYRGKKQATSNENYLIFI